MIVIAAFKMPPSCSTCSAPLIGGGHTGAPGENTCAASGCHSGVINSGPDITSFSVGGGITSYTSGQTYQVDIKIVQSSVAQFGFQVIALKDSDNSMAGTDSLTDTYATRLIPLGTKTYVGTTPCGSDAIPPDSLQWSFDWKAPTNYNGGITFYLCTIATNHDCTSNGDNTYSTTLHLVSNSSGIYEVKDAALSADVYPNPANTSLTISFPNSQISSRMNRENSQLLITDIIGNEVYAQSLNKSTQTTIDISKLSKGIYFYQITIPTQSGKETAQGKFVKD